MTWMTPLDALTSAVLTVALSTFTARPLASIATELPSTVLAAVFLPLMSLAMTLPGTTWYVRIFVSCALFSGLSRFSTVPAGSFLKASSVGAKTVNGPGPLRVSTRPAAFTAATRVVKLPFDAAVSTMSAAAAGDANTSTVAAASKFLLIDIFFSYRRTPSPVLGAGRQLRDARYAAA